MGIGLIFWGVAEPVRHFHANPFVAEGGTAEAATVSLRLAFFHRGLHARALYALFEALALPGVVEFTLAAAATLLIAVYFVTSCDSGTLAVTTMLACGHGDPPLRHRIVWGVGEGAIAALLLVAGGLTALQAAVITAGLPFSVVMAGMAYAFLRALRDEEAAPRPVATAGRGRASEPWTGRDDEAADTGPAGSKPAAERP